jgi:molybdopterin/thiamine biosynthesis adenylyltransferase
MKRAVLLGVGGLGCPAALALAESGEELELVLVDDDRVERSNLARQILFGEADVGAPKAEAAARRLAAGGGRLRLVAVAARFDASTAQELLAGADVLLDGTDNFETRFLANDVAVAARVPLVHGAAVGWTGQLLTVIPGRTACLRCLFEGPPPPGALPTCAEAGVASPLCGLVGAAMAQAALAVLQGAPAAGVLSRWDGLRGIVRPLPLSRDFSCPCGILG